VIRALGIGGGHPSPAPRAPSLRKSSTSAPSGPDRLFLALQSATIAVRCARPPNSPTRTKAGARAEELAAARRPASTRRRTEGAERLEVRPAPPCGPNPGARRPAKFTSAVRQVAVPSPQRRRRRAFHAAVDWKIRLPSTLTPCSANGLRERVARDVSVTENLGPSSARTHRLEEHACNAVRRARSARGTERPQRHWDDGRPLHERGGARQTVGIAGCAWTQPQVRRLSAPMQKAALRPGALARFAVDRRRLACALRTRAHVRARKVVEDADLRQRFVASALETLDSGSTPRFRPVPPRPIPGPPRRRPSSLAVALWKAHNVGRRSVIVDGAQVLSSRSSSTALVRPSPACASDQRGRPCGRRRPP